MHTRALYASQCTHQNAWENRERDRPDSNSTSGAKFTEQSHVFPHEPRKYPTTNYSTWYLFLSTIGIYLCLTWWWILAPVSSIPIPKVTRTADSVTNLSTISILTAWIG